MMMMLLLLKRLKFESVAQRQSIISPDRGRSHLCFGTDYSCQAMDQSSSPRVRLFFASFSLFKEIPKR